MKTAKVLVPAIAGTTAMTIFSYLVSEFKNKNFRELEVLGQLINRLPIIGENKYSHLAGWGAHYGTGILFETVFTELWERKKIKPSLASGALLGAASGLIGILVWKGTFEAHPNPPTKNLKPFFDHLMLAHIVFGVFSALTYKTTFSEQNP